VTLAHRHSAYCDSKDAELMIARLWVHLPVWSLSSGYYLVGWMNVCRQVNHLSI